MRISPRKGFDIGSPPHDHGCVAGYVARNLLRSSDLTPTSQGALRRTSKNARSPHKRLRKGVRPWEIRSYTSRSSAKTRSSAKLLPAGVRLGSRRAHGGLNNYATAQPHGHVGIDGGIGGAGGTAVTSRSTLRSPTWKKRLPKSTRSRATGEPPDAIPAGARIALFADPEGHVVGLVQPGRTRASIVRDDSATGRASGNRNAVLMPKTACRYPPPVAPIIAQCGAIGGHRSRASSSS